ncbi:MAG: hypothetical protein ABIK65_10370 [Candidatus Eisenbacteria bacterium]
MKHLGRIAVVAFCMTFLVAGVTSVADACDGNKTGVQKASSSGCASKGVAQQASASCSANCTKPCCASKGAVQQTSSGCAGKGVMQQAAGSLCTSAASASCQAMTCSKTGKVLGTVQLIPTDGGFRVVTVGCKTSGRNFLEKSATVLNTEHRMKGEIHEAKDGLYMDVNGEAAKNVYQKWQSWARSGATSCLLTTESGECLISADALGVRAG